MSWQSFGPPQRGGRVLERDWDRIPAVRFGKSYLVLNKPFVEAFNIKPHDAVDLLFRNGELGSRALGIKKLTGDAVGTGRMVHSPREDRGARGTCVIHCSQAAKRFPDCPGQAYRAHLNSGQRVIEISLEPGNILR